MPRSRGVARAAQGAPRRGQTQGAGKAVADSFAASQLRVLRADHLSSHRAGGVPAADATPEGAARIEAMQQMMLGWATDRAKPTAFDVCAAHAALVDGGGMLRTKPVRAGNTRFATPVAQVQKRLEELIAGLRAVSARTDLSDVAKAAWAGYNFLALHPFPDGNGRMARGLVNMVLARFGCPFVVGFAANEVQRAAYRTARREPQGEGRAAVRRADQGVRGARLGGA